jgi:hypothetical protein
MDMGLCYIDCICGVSNSVGTISHQMENQGSHLLDVLLKVFSIMYIQLCKSKRKYTKKSILLKGISAEFSNIS